ncbi:periodic tryptophan protein 2 homolog [Lingula anatina]|uniref:Periodic tryptophan protein 2 homolog n=1 Tax=Lingula anatina TaxID=7574 RepID=A0A1S3HL23_LINAN|nr:periodic tryptophan protein 2 homolog [Lingula anatina]|eukprot:XP_013385709.1 periodic tryptophan protein 2 homolog [Lingula anatina]
MKFSYRFSNLLGTVYRKGNLIFSPDGNSVISPVGNRITVFDLKNNKSETLPVESRLNITAAALSPDANLLIAVNEEGEAILISLVSKTVLHSYHFHRPVHAIKFSPDGRKFAVTKENNVLVFHAPGKTMEFNPFVLERTFFGAYDETVCIDWTTNSKAFLVGSKDMNTRVYGAERFANLVVYSLGGHSNSIVAAFFEEESLDMISISENGQLCVWECDTDLDGLRPYQAPPQVDSSSEEEEMEESKGKQKKKKKEQEVATQDAEKTEDKILYKRLAKHNYKEARGEGAAYAKLTSAAYHKRTHILCSGFEDGAFFLHEMPDFNLIHSLSISDQSIISIEFNKPGDWIALGCAGLGQLLVWEWQSESYILKQQGHFNNMSCLAYSPDGQYIATGGDDGKVKVWNTSSGLCFVTFNEHLGGISGVAFSQSGQVVVTASLDGTVRAFDLNRYRNFRTFTSPRPVQFSSLALDSSGEIVCAGGLDVFEIFVWSMKTGRLLEVLAGHEGPISSLAFSTGHAILASTSWDKTVKLWDIFESKGSRETILLGSDVLGLAYRPDGAELAVSTLNGHISFWDVHSAVQTGSIEGRPDLGYSRKELDKITAKKSAGGKAFTSLCYTADGQCILAAGRSKNVCIYSVADQILIRKFEISCNLSFDGMEEYLDRRKMTEWGSLALVDEAAEDGKTSIALPGVKKGDMSSRHWKPEVLVSCVRFSPTGRAWAATSTEGLLIYSLDHNLIFDPFDLEMDITPENVRRTLARKEYTTSLMLSFRLNEHRLIQEVVEQVPVGDLDFVCQSLPDLYIEKLLGFVGGMMETSRHVEFYLLWCQKLLMLNGPKLKQKSQSILALLRTLQKNITKRSEELGSICDHNQYILQYLLNLGQAKRKRGDTDPEHQEDTEQESVADDSDLMQSSDSESVMT